MKRTYVNTLPKGETSTVKSVKIVNGRLIVEVEFEKKFEPKDGDFVVDKDGVIFIVWEGGNTDFSHGAYVSIDSKYKELNTHMWNYSKAIRYATEKEKFDLLEHLEKEYHKRWNAENKCLENIRWQPKKGERFYYIDVDGSVNSCVCSGFLREFFNCFKTKEAAQPYADQIKEIFKNSKAE